MAFEAVSACSLLDALSGQNKAGAVRAVFSRAVYVGVDDLLVTIAFPGSGNVPYGVILPDETAAELTSLQPGMRAGFRHGRIHFPESGKLVDFSKAVRWSSQLTIGALEGRKLAANLGNLREELRMSTSGREGLAPVSDYIARLPEIHGMNNLNPSCRTAMPVLSNVTRMWKEGRLSDVPAEIQRLLGLGPGLTPSGDDFVIGMMAVLWLASRIDNQNSEALIGLAAKTGCLENDRTTGIGAFFVKQASLGRFPEKLQNLVTALPQAGEGRISRSVRELLELGATSGRDMAAGVAFGAYLVFEEISPAGMKGENA